MTAIQFPVVATTTLTDAQIKTLPSSAVELLAAPGAGKAIVVLSAILVIDTMAGVYTNCDGTTCKLSLNYENDNEDPATQPADENSELFLSITPAVSSAQLLPAGAHQTYANVNNDIDNKGIAIGLDNGISGNLTGGNAANSLTVSVVYIVINV